MIAAAGLVAVVAAIGLNYLAPEIFESDGSAGISHAPSAPSLPDVGAAAVSLAPEATFAHVPSFDVVRVKPGGDAVIAGRAEPGASVVLSDGERVLGEVNADSRGEWVFVPDTPLLPGSHRLGLEMRLGTEAAVSSTDEVIVVVPKPGEDVAGRPTTGTSQPLALRQPRSGGPAVVMQAPASTLQDAVVAVDAVDAGGKGWVVLTGRAPAGARVRISIDGQRLGEVIANSEGQWHLRTLHRLDASQHGISVELLDAKGGVVARSGVPLPLGDAGGTATPADGRIVVQRGENLWRIARSAYGRGTSYMVIYEANRGRIADPDLIYPGQVFQLPPEGTTLTETGN